MNFHSERLYNLTIKVFILISKFLLMICLAKSLETYELGIYGLIQSIIVYYMYFSGFDLYTYSTREYIKEKNEKIIIKHFKSIFLMSILGALFGFIILENVESVAEYIPLTLALAILEHYNQEIGRILIAKKLQLKASIQLFIRTALWCYIIAIIVFIKLIPLDLIFVLKLWIIFSFISIVYGMFCLSKSTSITFFSFYKEKLSFSWFTNAIKTSMLFFIGTLATRTIFVVDKTYFDYVQQLNDLGIYVFYSSFAGVLLSFCDSAIFQFSYPKLIQLYKEAKGKAMKDEMAIMLVQCFLMSLIFAIASYISLGWLINFIGNEEYINNIKIFWILLLLNFILACSNVFHYLMYSFNLDKQIMAVNVFNLLIFSIILFLGHSYCFTAIETVIFAIFSSSLIACLVKAFKVYKKFNEEF